MPKKTPKLPQTKQVLWNEASKYFMRGWTLKNMKYESTGKRKPPIVYAIIEKN